MMFFYQFLTINQDDAHASACLDLLTCLSLRLHIRFALFSSNARRCSDNARPHFNAYPVSNRHPNRHANPNRHTDAHLGTLRYAFTVCYVQSGLRFPTLYLLHGLSYREEQWEDIGLIEALDRGIRENTIPPMIVIMPYLGSLGQYNTFPPSPSYETYLLEELLPRVERQICTWEDRNFRAIGGILGV
jgi:S-formylglutathione hydrolase FrmB